jgi:hypothetical protein
MHCLAMGYGGEPLERIVHSVERGIVYLIHPSTIENAADDPLLGVGFPEEFVFEANAALMAELRAAYERGDSALLAQLWRKAVPLKPEIDEE